MPEEIIARILRLPGYGIYAWEADEGTNTLTLWIRQTVEEPYYVCGGCGISVGEIHSWRERRVRDLPWGTWTVWLQVEVHRVRCRHPIDRFEMEIRPPCGPQARARAGPQAPRGTRLYG